MACVSFCIGALLGMATAFQNHPINIYIYIYFYINTSCSPLIYTQETKIRHNDECITSSTHVSLCITAKPWLGAADSAPDPVLDLDSKKARTGADYYILPVIRGRGGGLALASTRNKTCPLNVVQERLECCIVLETNTKLNLKSTLISLR